MFFFIPKNKLKDLPVRDIKHKNIELSHDVRVTLSWNFSKIDMWKSPMEYIENPDVKCSENEATSIIHDHPLSGCVSII